MALYKLIVSCAVITLGLGMSAQAAFVSNAGPLGGIIDDFNDGVVDTATWAEATIGSPIAVSEAGTELKIVQTLGFNGAYSTLANGADGTGSSDGSGLVEPKTAGNNNHRIISVMRRRDPRDDRVSMGLSITTNVYLRTCGDVGDYACLTWGTEGANQSDIAVGENDYEIFGGSSIGYQLRNDQTNPPMVNTIATGSDQVPMYDWGGKTRYAFEIDWQTITDIDFKVHQILRPDQNNDFSTDIVDFGIFAGDFGKSGTGDNLNSGYVDWDGTFSDFDDSGAVDIVDFAEFAGAFGESPIIVFDQSVDWSGPPDLLAAATVCGDGSCWPSSLGAQIYAHNVGTLWVDYVVITGDSAAAQHSPEPTSLVLLGVAGLALLRRHRRRRS